ncbi:hypothetical protein ACUY4Q_001016 [Phytobacter sp. AG2a]|jgi:hypothetical protein
MFRGYPGFASRKGNGVRYAQQSEHHHFAVGEFNDQR